jgi:hypothetical protein
LYRRRLTFYAVIVTRHRLARKLAADAASMTNLGIMGRSIAIALGEPAAV